MRRAWTTRQKTRVVKNHHMDSDVWRKFKYRDNDIIVASYPKAGTTWVQQIVGQLIFDGSPDVAISEISPWLEFRIPSSRVKIGKLESQRHRRFIKTHLPPDAIGWHAKTKYIYVGSDGRDVALRLYHHHRRIGEFWRETLNCIPGRSGPEFPRGGDDFLAYWREWLYRDGHPYWSFWENVSSWWRLRREANLLLVHYSELTRDLPGQIRRIADFLDIRVDPVTFQAIAEHCSFAWMKEHAEKCAPLGGCFIDEGSKVFFDSDRIGEWRSFLPSEEVSEYSRQAESELGIECTYWIETGHDPAFIYCCAGSRPSRG